MKYLRMELKVCEGCGALWLRMEEVRGVYCVRCATKLSTFPAARAKHAGGRKTKLSRVQACCGGAR